MESGVSGIPRAREWDATVVTEVGELAAEAVDELELRAFPDAVVPDTALARALAAAVDRELERPYHAVGVRRDRVRWAVGARSARSELARLPGLGGASYLELVVAPDGDERATVDGVEAPDADAATERAVRHLEDRGRSLFQAFVARADRLDEDLWEVTIDPL